MKMIDTVKENVNVQITTSQAHRMRFLEETGSNRLLRLERDRMNLKQKKKKNAE
jgi:hypothetical protein